MLGAADVLSLAGVRAARRIPYGEEPLQFADLRLPPGAGPHPVAVLVHGGCWSAPWDVRLMEPLAAALVSRGVATWSVAYRRVGDGGGGWPGTFRDVAAGADLLAEVAGEYALDLGNAVAVGHSAGAHLTLWLASRSGMARRGAERPIGSPEAVGGSDGVARSHPLQLKAVAALAGIVDLRAFLVRDAGPGDGEEPCGAAVRRLLDGLPEAVPHRYAATSPRELLPLGVRQLHLTGARDPIVPPRHGAEFRRDARRLGDPLRFVQLPHCGHFEPIHPAGPAWAVVEPELLALFGANGARDGG